MNCDWIAPWYRLLEYLVFGGALERRRREFIHQAGDPRRVLILGDGDGRFTAEFVRSQPTAAIDSIDLSAGMLELARRRVAGSSVTFYQADARTATLTRAYDLIVTHFFLDCFAGEEIDSLVARAAAAASPGAKWLVSEFQIPETGLWRRPAALLIGVMYRFFQATTGLKTRCLPNYAIALRAHGFERVFRATAWGGMLVSEVWVTVDFKTESTLETKS